MYAVQDPFPAEYRVTFLDAIPVGAHPLGRHPSLGSVSIAASISLDDGRRWIAVFTGGPAGLARALTAFSSTPSPSVLLAIVAGDGILVNTDSPKASQNIGARPILAINPFPKDGSVVLATPWELVAVDANGVRWTSKRLAIEGLRIRGLHHGILGVTADPGDDAERPLDLDIRTGAPLQTT